MNHANHEPDICRKPERVRPDSSGALSLSALIRRLTSLGFDAGALHQAGAGVCGVPLVLSVDDLLQSPAKLAAVIGEVAALLQQRIAVTLALRDVGCDDAAFRNLQCFCEYLQGTISAQSLPGSNLGLCIDSHCLPLQAYQVLSSIIPGKGPRLVVLDSLQMTPQSSQSLRANAHSDWSFLWRDRLSPTRLTPVYGSTVRTGCHLLSDEASSSVLPVAGVNVPAASAWLPLGLSVADYASASGEPNWQLLLPALAEGIALADDAFDRLTWANPLQRMDARSNRRLALSLGGLGELIKRRGCDPRDLASLNWLSEIVGRIRTSLWCHSQRMAQQQGYLPALHDADPSRNWPDHTCRENWRRRWQAALEESGVRHRNMLVLSPYSVLPDDSRGSDGHADLLPVIAFADVWAFADAPHFRQWSREEFASFHRRAWAVMQQPETPPVVAAGV